DGIYIESASNNIIGGTNPGAGNVIAFNGVSAAQSGIGLPFGNGVEVFADGTGNTILGNAIFSNFLLGIDLNSQADRGGDGVTPNDPGDPDAGTNNLQNFPLLSSAKADANNTTVAGSLNSTPSTSFRLEFFANATADSSGHGE